MNWNEVEGRWMQIRGQLKSKWGKLTDDDLMQCAGKRDQLIGKIENRYGIMKEEAARQVDEWVKQLDLKPARADEKKTGDAHHQKRSSY